jgi:hypothetical protein
MQRSSLTDSLHILVATDFKGFNIADFTFTLEYILPVSRKYVSETLVAEEEIYKDSYLEYVIPVTSRLSEEAGDIELKITLSNVGLDENGKKTQYLIHSKETSVTITPLTNWSDIIPDEALTALDNRILALDGQIKALNELQGNISASIPDDLGLTEGLLQLTHKGNAIGEGVKILAIDEDYVQDDADDGASDGVVDIDNLMIVEMGG